MSDIVIKAVGIGKSYLIGHQSRREYDSKAVLEICSLKKGRALWMN